MLAALALASTLAAVAADPPDYDPARGVYARQAVPVWVRLGVNSRGSVTVRSPDGRSSVTATQAGAGEDRVRLRTSGRIGVRSIDLGRERVDGGAPSEPLTDAQVRARKRLSEMERALGRTMHRVTQAVLVEGMSMETIAADLFGRAGEVSAKYYGRLFRDALDVLAGEYGLAGR
jgi:hypothetical protein